MIISFEATTWLQAFLTRGLRRNAAADEGEAWISYERNTRMPNNQLRSILELTQYLKNY